MSTTSPAAAALPRPRQRTHDGDALQVLLGSAATCAATVLPERPRLRGWLHAGFAPVVAAAGAALLTRTDTPLESAAVAVYGAVSLLLFTTSALYHRRAWSSAGLRRMKQLDHGNIPLVIAASATPVLVLGLPGAAGTWLLGLLWAAAATATAARWLWPDCPRGLHTAVTAGLGWVLVPALPVVAAHGAVVVALLVAASGALLTVGAVVYATRWPEPWPRWFGHHEVFHALTVVAWPLHAGAVWLLCA